MGRGVLRIRRWRAATVVALVALAALTALSGAGFAMTRSAGSGAATSHAASAQARQAAVAAMRHRLLYTAAAAPANDNWSDAISLTPVGGGYVQDDNTGATRETGEPGSSFGNTVWFRYDAARSAPLELLVQAGYTRPSLAVYTGDGVSSLTPVGNPATGQQGTVGLSFNANADTTYWIQVGTFDDTPNSFVLSWTANDNFADAVALTPPSAGVVVGDNSQATTESGEPGSGGGGVVHTVWYRYVPTADGHITFSLETSYNRGELAVYTGDALDTLHVVVSQSGQSSLAVGVDVTANTTYWIQVGAQDDSGGTFGLIWQQPPVNDDFGNALPMSPASGGAVGGDNSTATTQSGEPGTANSDVGHTVWYGYDAATNGPVFLSLSPDYNRGYLGVYTGETLDTLVPTVPAASGQNPSLEFNAEAGTTYWVQVGDVDDSGGDFSLTWSTAPSNDAWANAALLDGANGSTSGNNARASTETGEPGGFTNTVWYSFTPGSAGTLSLSAAMNDFRGSLAAYTGDSVDGLEAAGTPDSGSANLHTDVPVAGGTTYWIQVGTSESPGGAFTLTWAFTPSSGPPPANDNFANAITLPAGQLSGTVRGSNVNATTEAGEPTFLEEADVDTGRTIWWRAVAPATGDFTVDTLGSTEADSTNEADTTLAIFTGSDVAHLTEIASNDDSETDDTLNSSVTFHAVQGTTYYAQVGAFENEAGEVGDIVLNWAPAQISDYSDFYVNSSWTDFSCGQDPDGPGPATSFCNDSFRTIEQALAAAGPNDTIHVAGGDYSVANGAGTLDVTQHDLTITGAGTAVDGGTHVHLGHLFVDAPDVTIEGLDVIGRGSWNPQDGYTGPSGPVVRFGSGGNDGTFADNRVSQGYRGIAIGGGDSGQPASDVTLSDNVVTHNQVAILVDGASDATVVGNDVVDNGGFLDDNAGVAASIAVVDLNGFNASDNTITENSVTGALGVAIFVNDDADFTEISDNIVSGNAGAAVLLGTGAAHDTAIVSNRLENNGYGLYVDDSDGGTADTEVHFNRIDGNAIAGIQNADTGLVDAENNWWGAASGPSGDYPGAGDKVIQNFPGNVDASPFWADPNGTTTGPTTTTTTTTTTTETTTTQETTTTSAPAAPSFVPPGLAGSAASSVGATSATVSASIDPKGGPTRWSLNYGTSTSYDHHVGPALLDTATEARTVSEALSGLTAGTTYHFQFVATNDAGTTTGPDVTFTTLGGTTTTGPSTGPLPPPEEGKSVNVFVFSGLVFVNGIPLTDPSQITVGSTIDTTKGTVTLQSIGPGGNIQTASFSGGVFTVQQPANGITILQLTGGNFGICPTKRRLAAAPKPNSKKTVRDLWGNGTGSFQTKGRYAAATVRGTVWHLVDRCDGTLVVVERGVVSVNDLVKHKTVQVTAGHSYFAAKG